ncbi:MAG: tetratricopeptide repeat protein [Acidobacteriota bacterium]|nr:tetratricopeptide repeat protein [Acidobacteriota bacterium]
MGNLLLFLWLAQAAAIAGEQPSIERAMALVSAGNLEAAAAMLGNLEIRNPSDPDPAYRLGLVLLKQGKLDDSRRHLELAAKLAPERPLIQAALGVLHNSLAKAAAARNDAPAAAKEFQEAIRLDPTRSNYYVDLAQILMDHETPEPAEVVLRNAQERFPGNSEVLRLLGLADYAQGKNREALDAFLQSIDADPDSESGYASLEVLLPDAGQRLPEIAAKLRNFSQRHPASPIGPFLLAQTIPEQAPEQAEGLLRRALRAAPDFWPAWFAVHKLLKAQDKWDEAEAALKKTIELNPDFAPAHYALAECYNRKGDRARAARERELHHQLLARQRDAEERHRAQAPRLDYTVADH